MAKRRRPPRKKQPSPPPPPPQPAAESSGDEEEELESDSGKESGEERGEKQMQSKASGDDVDNDSNEGDDSGEEDSKSEPEQPTPNRSPSATAAPTVTSPAATSEEDDEGDESEEADSETEEEQPVTVPAAPSSATTGKLSDENAVPETGRNVATSPKTTTKEAAKKSSQRIWSDEDQITLLEGMVNYIATQGKDPIANIEGFWLFVRKKLSFPVTEWQLMRKIRAVKTKYRGNWEKDRAFSRAYDAKVFELSKKVWGAGEKSVVMENGGGKKRKSGKLDKAAEAVEIENGVNDGVVDDGLEWENETVNLSKEHFDWSAGLARVKIKSVAESERELFLQRWKKLKAEEMRGLFARRSLEVDTMKTIF